MTEDTTRSATSCSSAIWSTRSNPPESSSPSSTPGLGSSLDAEPSPASELAQPDSPIAAAVAIPPRNLLLFVASFPISGRPTGWVNLLLSRKISRSRSWRRASTSPGPASRPARQFTHGNLLTLAGRVVSVRSGESAGADGSGARSSHSGAVTTSVATDRRAETEEPALGGEAAVRRRRSPPLSSNTPTDSSIDPAGVGARPREGESPGDVPAIRGCGRSNLDRSRDPPETTARRGMSGRPPITGRS